MKDTLRSLGRFGGHQAHLFLMSLIHPGGSFQMIASVVIPKSKEMDGTATRSCGDIS